MKKKSYQDNTEQEMYNEPMKRQSKNNSFERFFVAKQGKKVKMNLYIFYTLIPVLVLFGALITYLVRFMIYESPGIITSSYNKRTSVMSERVTRGQIKSANDKVLAETITGSDGKDTRSYPYENMFAHVVGYAEHGKGGIESEYNYDLLTSHTDILDQIKGEVLSNKPVGDTVVTTLDTRLQKAAYEAMSGYKGAVIAIEPKTGKVRAMVSKPDFDPNTLDQEWEDISSQNESAILLNRCIQGLYPPGSTYKVLTTLEYIREHPDNYNDFSYNCEAETIVKGVHISCYHDQDHGEEDITKAFAKSCNTAFVTMGTMLNMNKFIKLNEKALFNEKIPFDLEVKKSRFAIKKNSDESEMPQTVIGQGNTLMTPFHNALVMCAIANEGIMMKPYLIDHIENAEGTVIKETDQEEYKSMMSEEEAAVLKDMLKEVVDSGTATQLQSDLYSAAGKTGTAENEKELPHSWFVGFSNVKEPDLVVCVVVENQGAGSEYAVPIAKEVFDCFYNNDIYHDYYKY